MRSTATRPPTFEIPIQASAHLSKSARQRELATRRQYAARLFQDVTHTISDAQQDDFDDVTTEESAGLGARSTSTSCFGAASSTCWRWLRTSKGQRARLVEASTLRAALQRSGVHVVSESATIATAAATAAATAVATTAATTAAAATVMQPSSSTHSVTSRLSGAFFGRPLAKTGAEQKLAFAFSSIEQRIAQLEARGVSQRAQAKAAHAAGNKVMALRSLKLAKASEEKASKLHGLAVAIERQRDTLEDVGLQQNIAQALGAGVANMKKAQKALKGVEAIADETVDMRDVAEDLSAALATLGDTAFDDLSLDDDDLIAELETMQTPMHDIESEAREAATTAAKAVTSKGASGVPSSIVAFPVAPIRLPEDIAEEAVATRPLAAAS
jgi:hypothetical protein